MSLIAVDSSDANKQASFQAIQEAFLFLTQKSDTLSQEFKSPVICKVDDIENLCDKILQIAKTYQLHSTGFHINVSYADNNSSSFNSVESFKLKVCANNSSINSIVLECSFLILHEQTRNLNKYNVKFHLNSGASILKRMHIDGAPAFLKNFFSNNAQTKIEYVDYIIAENFLNTIKNWHQGLTNYDNYNKSIINSLQKYSHFFSGLSRFLFYFLFLYIVYKIEDKYINFDSLKSVFNFSLLSTVLFFVVRSVFSFLGDKAESNIDNISSSSFIIITTGDEKLYKEIEKNNSSNFYKFWINISIQFIIGVTSGIVATYFST